MLTELPLLAETNGLDFSWHKYWSRKPSSLVGSYIANLLPEGGTLLDPCCGSGVALVEATKAGCLSIGIDVNPIACELSRVQVHPPDAVEFRKTAHQILDFVEAKFGGKFTINDDRVRFAIHQVVIQCEGCGTFLRNSLKKPRITRCLCGRKVSFSLKFMSHTSVAGVQLESGDYVEDAEVIKAQEILSREPICTYVDYSHELVENRRTLSFHGFSTSDFFTKRNFSLISLVLDQINELDCSENLRRALTLWVTGSSAQLSRLTAWRNGLTTGGPAWTVPGFWIPPIHLECNPFIYLKSRIEKLSGSFLSMTKYASSLPTASTPQIFQGSALEKLSEFKSVADLVFFDPPYGDSIAFTEFSAIWNGLLRTQAAIEKDISISDRTEKPFLQEDYGQAVGHLWVLIKEALRPNGRVVATFHNHNVKTWSDLVEGFQSAGLRLLSAEYHDPAVISTKARLSPQGSYIGDFYLILEPSDRAIPSFADATFQLRESLSVLWSQSQECVTRSIALRYALETALNMGIKGGDIVHLESLVDEFQWTTQPFQSTQTHRETRINLEVSKELSSEFTVYWKDLWGTVCADKCRFVCASQREIFESVGRLRHWIQSDGIISTVRDKEFRR